MSKSRSIFRPWRRKPVVVPVVRLTGVVASGQPYRQQLSLEAVSKNLDRAFDVQEAPAVALIVNSPGGSPVQANLIYRRIRALAATKKKPVVIFVEDVAASGGYLIALAGDEVIVDPNSIIGSIGVVSAGFGFTGLMDKIGVERRLYTAGQSKAMLDPFSPEKPSDVEHLRRLQEEIHRWFIALVKERRPGLKDDPELFSGAFWTGAQAKELGLVDGLGDARSFLRERFGEKVSLPLFGEKRGFVRRWFGGTSSTSLAAGVGDAMIAALEERAHWGRFGL